MRSWLRHAACLLLLGMLAAAVQAQSRGATLTGRVVSATDGEPLSLVRVLLAGTPFDAVTDVDGRFRIAGVPEGRYILETTGVGFRGAREAFAATAGEARDFTISLVPDTITISETASVTASLFSSAESQGDGFALTAAESRNLGSVLADDPLRAVQHLPGVTASDDFSSDFSIRGAPFSRIGLYLDGILLHSPFHTTDGDPANGSLTLFSGDLTDEITLYQGAWPVRYGNRTAGVLAVTTRPGSRDGVHAQVSASVSNASAFGEGPLGRSRRGSWIVGLRQSYLQYLLSLIDFDDSAPLAFAFRDAQGRLDYDLTPAFAVSLSLVEGASSVDRSRYQNTLADTTLATSDSRSTLLSFGTRLTRPGLLLSTHLAWSGESGTVANRTGLTLSRQRYHALMAAADATIPWGAHTTVSAGGDARHITQAGLATRLTYTPALVATPDPFVGTATEGGAYLLGSVTRGRLHASGGARADATSLVGATVVSPYASLAWEAASGTRVEADWGRHAQFPEINQVRSHFAAAGLRPERATAYELQASRPLGSRTRVRLTLYDREDADLLAEPAREASLATDGRVVAASPTAPLLNAERGHARGLQLFVQRRTANGLTGWVSYAFGHTVVTDTVSGARFPADDDQHHTMNLYLSRRLRPTVNLSGQVTLGSGMPLPGFYQLSAGGYQLAPTRNALRAPGYQRLDVRVNKAYVSRRFEATLYAEVVNATNHTNRDFDTAGPYDLATGHAEPRFYTMLPVLPSVGLVVRLRHADGAAGSSK